MKRIATAAFAAGFLALGTAGAGAVCERAKTTGTVLGAAGGGVIGNVVTHGSVIGTLAGAAGGGFIGHRLSGNGCRRVAYYHHHRHYYVDRYGHRHYYHTATR
ncbi:MAG TPA: glycine zipper 2TM domain-containing protein [Rhizomicrobium sp.]|jgi:osmotically inducible lipoprotein OsmB|nr:glycine zipper 2TM domain-containing protein [Rhizomicrobium sp.]